MPLFAAGHNDPGYLPDSPPTITRDWQLARDALIEDLRYAADATQTWAGPHDCDDLPCPTYGQDCPDNLAADGDVNLRWPHRGGLIWPHLSRSLG